MNRILCLLEEEKVDTQKIKSRLYLILSDYEVEKRCTEVSVISEDETTKYVRLFLIGKRVAGRTDRTLQHYSSTLKLFFDEVQKNPKEITSDDIKFFLATKEVRDGASKVYQKNISRVLGSFYAWMQREEYIMRNPMNKVDEIKIPKVKREAFTEMQIEMLRVAADGNLRLSCMLEVLLSTWCRATELVQIKLKEISNDMESVLIHGKGSKDRTCYLNARAKLYLKKYLDERNDSNEYLFPNCWIGINECAIFAQECKKTGYRQCDWWKAEELVGTDHVNKDSIGTILRNLGKKAGVENVHPHRFRRTGATFALRRGMPIEQVSKLLGHESIETTQIYLDVSERELEQAHKKYVV